MYKKSLTCLVCKANFIAIYKIIVWPLRFILRIATKSKMIKLKINIYGEGALHTTSRFGILERERMHDSDSNKN